MRDIVQTLNAHKSKFNRLGFEKSLTRSNLSKADEIRKVRILTVSLLDRTELSTLFCNVKEEKSYQCDTQLKLIFLVDTSDDGIKAHFNLAALAYWLVSVTKYRLKLKDYEHVRWDEIIRIAKTQVVVTLKLQTQDGELLSVRQSTEAEGKLSEIYRLLF